MRVARAAARLTGEEPSVDVRWPAPLSVVIVTHLVTRSLAGRYRELQMPSRRPRSVDTSPPLAWLLHTTGPGSASHQGVWVASLTAAAASLGPWERTSAGAIGSVPNVVMAAQVALPRHSHIVDSRPGQPYTQRARQCFLQIGSDHLIRKLCHAQPLLAHFPADLPRCCPLLHSRRLR